MFLRDGQRRGVSRPRALRRPRSHHRRSRCWSDRPRGSEIALTAIHAADQLPRRVERVSVVNTALPPQASPTIATRRRRHRRSGLRRPPPGGRIVAGTDTSIGVACELVGGAESGWTPLSNGFSATSHSSIGNVRSNNSSTVRGPLPAGTSYVLPSQMAFTALVRTSYEFSSNAFLVSVTAKMYSIRVGQRRGGPNVVRVRLRVGRAYVSG